MARLPRFILPGQPQHVIQRGNNRQAIFCTDRDYEYYLEKLREATNKSWVLGDNQFKVAVEQQLARRVMPCAKGGDRKSRHYVESFKIDEFPQ